MSDSVPVRERRIHTDHDSVDPRSAFQRDRDRILYSKAFRRLAEVTQVVHVGESNIFHNRLTHSLKVAQVGRRLAEYHLEKYHDGEYDSHEDGQRDILDKVGGLEPNVVEAAALAHDLGHPPFGHIAEKELDDLLTDEIGVSGGFEGNAQSFRIINRVATHSNLNSDYKGLDLTRASLNAVLKYPWARSTGIEKKREKWGYYEGTEDDEFNKAREIDGLSIDEKCVEASIMDWADDLAYAIHDLVDFYKAGIIPLGELLRGDTTERNEFIDAFNNDGEIELEDPAWKAEYFLSDDINKISEFTGSQKGMTWKPLHSPYKNTRKEKKALNYLTSVLIERYLGVRGEGKNEVVLDPTENGGLAIPDRYQDEVALLKYATKYYVFRNPTLVTQQEGHKEIVKQVFTSLFKATEDDIDKLKMIPEPFKQEIIEINNRCSGNDEERHRARVTTDMVASLTESQMIKLCDRITGRSRGSVEEKIMY